jgi:hypothetical protein
MRQFSTNGSRTGGRTLNFEPLEARITLDASQLRITEFVASNDDSLADYDGDSSDWVELYNTGTTAVSLAGLYLTDNGGNKTKWQFPAESGSVEAGGYRVVFASSKNTIKPNGEIHTSFNLSAGGEYLALVNSDGITVIDQFAPEFPEQYEDVSYGRSMLSTGVSTTLVATGAQSKSWIPSSNIYDATWTGVSFNDAAFTIVGPTGIGYENNPGDGVNFTAEIGRTIPNTNISSVYSRISFNLSTLAGVDRLKLRMKYDDGFVAYINGHRVAEGLAPEVSQWNSLSTGLRDDSLSEQFVDFDVSEVIPFLQVGQNVLAIHGMNNVTTSSDMLISPELIASSAQIVVPDDIGYFENPTPGYGNGDTSVAGFVSDPVMSVPHGFYTSTQSVSISTTTPGTIIVYTTNGSTPTVNASLGVTNGILYSGPITVSSSTTLRASAFKLDWKPSFVTASSYFFTSDIIGQSSNGQVPGPGWAANGLNGQEINYGIDPDILSLYGTRAVSEALLSLPSISITTDLANLFNASTGIYVNATNRGKPWERPASVELIDPLGEEEGFMVNAGLRIRGGYSRNDFNPKHGFRLYFRGEYGAGHLEYPLFGDEGADEFNVLDLRTEQNYSWSSEGNLQNSFVREVFSRDAMRDLGQEYTRSRYYHLYLNGQYWGIYMTQERVEEYYSETYFGGSETDYDIVKHGLNDVGGTELAAGNDAAWRALFDYGQLLAANPNANANIYWTMQGLNPDGTRNPSLPVLLDVDNLIAFMGILVMTGGYDSGISQFLGDNQANNWFGVYNHTTADQGFQFYVHDNEHSLGAGYPDHSTLTIDRTGPFNNGNQNNYAQQNPQYLHQDLLGHPEYRQKFIDFVQKNFFNGGALTASNNIARLMERVSQVDAAIIAEAARWGDSKVNPPRNKSNWQNEINWLVNSYFPVRNNYVLAQLRNDGLFTNFNAPSFNQFGGDVPQGFELTMTASPGTIYYSLDGVTDPRKIGGGVNSAATVYTGAIPLSGTVTVKARLLSTSGAWSGLVETSFNVQGLTGDFDGDGDVDGRDFLAWQRGESAAPLSSTDLTDWQGNYGEVASVIASEMSSLVVGDDTPVANVDTTTASWWIAPLSAAYTSEPLADAVTEEYFEEVGVNTMAWGSVLPSVTNSDDGEFVPHYSDDDGDLEEFDAVFAVWEMGL